MKLIELNIKIVIKPGNRLADIFNSMITTISQGHYQGKSVSPSLLKCKGYNYCFTKQYKDEKDIKF